MMRNVMGLAALGLLACDDVTDLGTTTDSGGVPQCANPIDSSAVSPEPGADDAYYRLSRIIVELTLAEPTATVAVADAAGNPVTGSQSVDDTTITFLPDGPLVPNTDYVVTLSYSCGDVDIEWSTGSVGEPLEDDVVGRVYELDLAGGDWVEPPGVGAALGTFAASVEILVSPTEADKKISFLGALGDGTSAQDECFETFELTGASFVEPYFELETPLLPFNTTAVSMDIEDLFLSGAFAPDGSALSGVVLEGTIDTRPLAPAFELEGDDAVCNLLFKFSGAVCEECSDKSGPFCMSVRVEDISAPELVGESLVERDQKTIDKDPRCIPQKKK